MEEDFCFSKSQNTIVIGILATGWTIKTKNEKIKRDLEK